MRVLLVMNDGNHGGIAKSIIPLINHLNDIRFQLVCGSAGPFAEELKLTGFPVKIIDFTQSHFNLTILSQLRCAIRESRANLVHAHHPRAYLRSRFAAKLENIPHISTPHVSVLDEIEAYPVPPWRSKYILFRENVTSRLDNVTIALTQINKERLIAQGISAERIRIIPNGIDLDRFDPTKDLRLKIDLGWDVKDCLIGYVGRLAPEKMIPDLLHAFAKLPLKSRERGLNRLLIVGDGPERITLESTVNLLGLTERVRLTGHQEDVSKYLAVMDIVVFTSLRETLPFALLEAMAMGKPIVAVNEPVFLSILSDDSGLLFERHRLHEGLETFINNPGLAKQYGKKARHTVVANYAQANVLMQIRNTYREAIASSYPVS